MVRKRNSQALCQRLIFQHTDKRKKCEALVVLTLVHTKESARAKSDDELVLRSNRAVGNFRRGARVISINGTSIASLVVLFYRFPFSLTLLRPRKGLVNAGVTGRVHISCVAGLGLLRDAGASAGVRGDA
jgi:hypothetical protein